MPGHVRLPVLVALATFALAPSAPVRAAGDGAAGRAAATPASDSHKALHVHVVGLRNSNGNVTCTLFKSRVGFPSHDSTAAADMTVPVRQASATCDFRGLAPDRYALVVFHDENANGKFDKSLFAIPKEGYGFSNNVKPRFSPPSFDSAAFLYCGGEQSLTIDIMCGIPF